MGFDDKKMQSNRHNRSRSWTVPEKKKLEETKQNLSPDVLVQSSLKQEIQEHEKILQNQFDVRGALEKALGYKTPSLDINSTPKPATELIKEIAVLELEVSHLEQYLLSLYRKAFDQQSSSVSPSSPKSTLGGKRLDFSTTHECRCSSFDNRQKSPCLVQKEHDSPSLRCSLKESGSAALQLNQENSRIESRCFSFDNRLKDQRLYEEEDIDSSVRRCQSSLNQRSTFNNQISPPEDSVLACHSQPFSMKEHGSSLAEYMGTKISVHIVTTPNKLSEEMIKCASAIYSKLSDPHGFSYPSSSPSSTSQYDMWSPSFRKNFDDQFEFSGPYSSMLEVSHIHQNHRKGRDLDLMNRNFSLLIKKLEGVDPRKLSHQEKLAFWINVHNALVMHTFLANGVPQNNGKRFLLLSKPAYNIGGRMVSVEAVQSYILRIRMPRPSQWLKLLLLPRKFRTGDEHQEYSLDHSEPLLYFALCSGSHSDPAIRVYTPKGIYQELETAKEEYIRATYGVKKDQKLVLRMIIEAFSKDSGLSHTALMEMIQECLPEKMKERVKKISSGRSRKSIVEWTPHSFVFRYLIVKELVR